MCTSSRPGTRARTSSNPNFALVALASVLATKKKSASPMTSLAAATLLANCRQRKAGQRSALDFSLCDGQEACRPKGPSVQVCVTQLCIPWCSQELQAQACRAGDSSREAGDAKRSRQNSVAAVEGRLSAE